MLAPLRVQYSMLFAPAARTMVRFMWQLDTCAVAMFVAHALRFMDVAGTCALLTVYPMVAYTRYLWGQSLPNLSVGSSIARQAVWLDNHLMSAGFRGFRWGQWHYGISVGIVTSSLRTRVSSWIVPLSMCCALLQACKRTVCQDSSVHYVALSCCLFPFVHCVP